MSYWGASRCQPMGAPGRYSLIRAMANASESMPDHWATCARKGNRNAGSGPVACPVVRLAEERHSPPSDDTAHLEVRKRDIGDRFEEDSLLGVRDEVLAIVEAQGPIAFEESSRRCHDPVSHGSRSSSRASAAADAPQRYAMRQRADQEDCGRSYRDGVVVNTARGRGTHQSSRRNGRTLTWDI